MLKALIIEDEPLSAEKLSLLLQKVRDDIEVQSVISSVAQSVKWLKKNKPDIIFMDVHLSDGKSFEIFKQVKIETPIIFTTAYDQYALEAFKEFGIDYLMKPIVLKDLKRAFHKYEQIKSSDHDHTAIESLLKSIQKEGQENYLVNSGKEIKIIPSANISCIYAEDKSIYLLNQEGQKFLMSETLDKIEKDAPNFFFRANRKTIINLNKIKTIENYTYGRLLIKVVPHPSFDIIVPLERVSKFKSRIIRKI